ncbi:unnamed protein product [Paramecium sonneborni]|uniref:Uncharacterized protein n=1 Tax=Paramecium sonneborni TaxID=65129 RepID=A0A8S1PWH2_9CILI|nr:unnamed protein product [Paramecium sonneborni]
MMNVIQFFFSLINHLEDCFNQFCQSTTATQFNFCEFHKKRSPLRFFSFIHHLFKTPNIKQIKIPVIIILNNKNEYSNLSIKCYQNSRFLLKIFFFKQKHKENQITFFFRQFSKNANEFQRHFQTNPNHFTNQILIFLVKIKNQQLKNQKNFEEFFYFCSISRCLVKPNKVLLILGRCFFSFNFNQTESNNCTQCTWNTLPNSNLDITSDNQRGTDQQFFQIDKISCYVMIYQQEIKYINRISMI